MKCKFQKYLETAEGRKCSKPSCTCTNGECQFVSDVSPCSIAAAFDGFIPENDDSEDRDPPV